MFRKVAVIVAHPDDEVLGCGGTLAKHIKSGDEVHLLIVAEGATSRDKTRNREAKQNELTELAVATAKSSQVLGLTSYTLLQFPDNRMDSIDMLDVIKVVEEFIAKHNPAIVYTHHVSDVNIDHSILHDAVITACRPQPGFGIETILCFETASSSEWQTPDSRNCFIPNWFVDITDTIEIKMQALEHYHREMRPWPHSRSIRAVEHLNRWRGSSIGCEAAESFVLSRMIDKVRV